MSAGVFVTLIDASIVIYQKSLSLLLGPRCRFYPSCSSYARDCLKLYPFGKAVGKITRRLGRCHPFHPGGVDFP